MTDSLPDILAGPLLRRAEPHRVVWWLVASRPLTLQLLLDGAEPAMSCHDLTPHLVCLPIGRHAFIHLIDVPFETPLPQDVRLRYDLQYRDPDAVWQSPFSMTPTLCYPGEALPTLVLRSRLDDVLHGSCRKPHQACGDGLVRADEWVEAGQAEALERPAALLMTGDQIYADDVAGPMLSAIHALVMRLGLHDEPLEEAAVSHGRELAGRDDLLYRRAHLLPDQPSNEALRDKFFGGKRKPVFTTANAENHLMTVAEMLAMYLLVWSPVPWTLIEVATPSLEAELQDRYTDEARVVDAFVAGLPRVARVLAHLPSLMIFDDHDVTDDWNLTAAWEVAVYSHPFSRRIVGNALVAYLLCQGWGNDPDKMNAPLHEAGHWLATASETGMLDAAAHDGLIDHLLRFTGWGYTLDTTPKLVVLDTRTRRWRSERRLHRPSGLMDWEALCEFQQDVLEQPSVVIVSAAPIFGVKLIEGIQRLFTLAGKPLMVDAENWMAHRGAAHTMLNILRHRRTPQRYVILSGDVHYSFVYALSLRRGHQDSPRMWQITSSGLKNTFPETLLTWFDRLNRWLYAPWSPLNWLTKRRRIAVIPWRPEGARHGERLWNNAGIGRVRLNEQGEPSEIVQLGADARDTRFRPIRR
ncbi:alkaline phosphatase family protein [Larsenimonas rhizosphaerae]|uniref:alkaline phosphatase family protein n=1 Tax=Larsenimonas rhizosphaerae TaxID=2944682 RepID=UPI002033A2F5|nr:alkaline phosphatase family protein [Larsenimonas rhizosphaerae]MCM2129601.1 alkaline phosphatase family protein [Larsenimonas rhizosphaerae]